MIFQLVQKNLSILGIGKTQSILAYRMKVLIGWLLLGSYIITHLEFLFSEANTFQRFAESVFMSSVTVVGLWCFASLIYKREKLLEFIDESEKLIVLFKETLSDEYPSAVTEIFKAAHLVEQCSKIIYLVVGQLTTIISFLPRYVYCLYCYYIEDMGSTSFVLVDRTVWFPFDWKNPLGYSIAATIQTTMLSYLLFVIANILAFGIGCYLIGITATKEIQRTLYIADKRLRLKSERSLAMKRFTELIKWHSLIKQLLNDFSNMFQPLFMAAFIWSTLGRLLLSFNSVLYLFLLLFFITNVMNLIAICTTLLMIQFETIDLLVMIYIIFDGSYGFGFVFVVCELCQQVCDGFEEMNETMDQFYWPSYPTEVQRLLPIVIAFTQQPVEFKVFGSITCCRESFKKVVNSSFSYFMVIRRFF